MLGNSNKIESWIDLFFVSTIHIIGFGFSYDEIDIWWLLVKRKQILSELNIESNKIIFYGNVDIGKKKLLKKLNIIVVDYDSNPRKLSAYEKMYKFFLNKIEENINKTN